MFPESVISPFGKIQNLKTRIISNKIVRCAVFIVLSVLEPGVVTAATFVSTISLFVVSDYSVEMYNPRFLLLADRTLDYEPLTLYSILSMLMRTLR